MTLVIADEPVHAISQEKMEPLLVAVFADFVCPYSYLAVDQMDRLVSEYNVRVMWRPYWLHPETPLDGTPVEQLPATQERRSATVAWLKEMAPEQAARIRFPDRLYCSLPAFEALEFAAERDRSMPFKSAVFSLLWEKSVDIGQISNLQRAGEMAGLDAEELGRDLRERRHLPHAIHALIQAREFQITSTPTLLLGRVRINGWHYYEVLESALERQGISKRQSA